MPFAGEDGADVRRVGVGRAWRASGDRSAGQDLFYRQLLPAARAVPDGHPQGKRVCRISPEKEHVQVMIKIIVKMLIFNVCIQLDNNREWLEEHEEELKKEGDMD